jgi:metal-responsive CopG/Arc/MetJ family transcriptional regulator
MGNIMDIRMEARSDTSVDKTVDLHVSLPMDLIAQLDRVAGERRVKRVQVLREAVADYLKRLEAERVGREMKTYADEMAAHSGDFVRETSDHVKRRLLRETEW